MIRRSAYAWSCFQEDWSAEDILCEIYCHNMQDKSPQQGRLMAQELLSWMARFQQGYDAVLDHPDDYVERVLIKEIEALSPDEQCRVLRQVIASLQPDGGHEKADESAQPSDERDILLRRAVERLTSKGSTAEEELSVKDDAPQNRRILKAVCGDDMVLAVNAMLLYTMAKNGELTEIPRDVSLAQVVIGVCTEDLLHSICRAEQSGYISEKIAQQQKCAASTVYRVLMLAAPAALAGGLAMLFAPGLIGGLTIGLALFAGLNMVLPEKFKMDRQMVEDHADDITAVEVELPTVEDVRGERQTTEAADCKPLEHESEDWEEQEQPEESTAELF